jgi:hypothetical protein
MLCHIGHIKKYNIPNIIKETTIFIIAPNIKVEEVIKPVTIEVKLTAIYKYAPDFFHLNISIRPILYLV